MKADFSQMILDIVEAMEPIVIACQKYRTELEANGFSPTAAEQMVVDLHRGLVHSAFGVKKP